jgi:repressor LexA
MMSSTVEAARTSAPGMRDAHVQRHLRTPADLDWQKTTLVPVVGRIRAGDPNLAEESVEDAFRLPRRLVGGGTHFLLKVVGDSMIDSGIVDGDWVVVRRQPVAENGEVVAAMVGTEATIKTLKRSNGQVWLVPHNPAYAPIRGDDATVIGKVVLLLRQLG